MRKLIIAAAATFAFAGLAACGESAADKQAEAQADALEAQAADHVVRVGGVISRQATHQRDEADFASIDARQGRYRR